MCHLILFLPVFALPVFWFFPFQTAMSIYLIILGVYLILYFKIFKAMRLKPRLGMEGMLGKTGVVIKDINPEGKIRYGSEIWDAISEKGKLSEGTKVIICGFLGMKLLLKKRPGENQ
ncbi:MAG: NfeD family protein [Desulfobacterales bacterium]|nr:NfeD family protein [Desulfobacterales bacterium]